MLRLTGNIGQELGEVRRKVAQLASATELRKLASDLAEQTVNLIAEGFRGARDPYGNPWNAPNNLQIAGDLSDYAPTSVTRNGFMVSATDDKAIWHHAPRPRKGKKRGNNWGGKALPTRRQVPVVSLGLPSDWAQAYSDAAEDWFESRFL